MLVRSLHKLYSRAHRAFDMHKLAVLTSTLPFFNRGVTHREMEEFTLFSPSASPSSPVSVG